VAIKKSFVPDVYPGTLRPEFRVEGDPSYRSFSTEAAAEKREAELADDSDQR
jgi:hypothetical protein